MVLPPVLDQSYSFGRNELKSNGNDDVGRAEGIEKVVGSALCVGMERKVGKAQRSTISPRPAPDLCGDWIVVERGGDDGN